MGKGAERGVDRCTPASCMCTRETRTKCADRPRVAWSGSLFRGGAITDTASARAHGCSFSLEWDLAGIEPATSSGIGITLSHRPGRGRTSAVKGKSALPLSYRPTAAPSVPLPARPAAGHVGTTHRWRPGGTRTRNLRIPISPGRRPAQGGRKVGEAVRCSVQLSYGLHSVAAPSWPPPAPPRSRTSWDVDGKPGGTRTRDPRISDEPPPAARERTRIGEVRVRCSCQLSYRLPGRGGQWGSNPQPSGPRPDAPPIELWPP